jgi:2-C-methyl-D-erythritol 4-phosphate cytidylyltransferase
MSGLVVIVPAAGFGIRFGGSIPKQFQALAGKPILQYAIERFLLDEEVERVIVPVSEQLLASVKNSERLRFIAGGNSRQESVIRGVAEAGDAEYIGIHDAVRPLFTLDLFHAVLAAARESGAALPALELSDTIHMVADGLLTAPLNRNSLRAAQTPQCFRGSLLRDVLKRAAEEGVEGTDEAGLAARYGHTVTVVPGEATNLKITRPEDLLIAEAYLANEAVE